MDKENKQKLYLSSLKIPNELRKVFETIFEEVFDYEVISSQEKESLDNYLKYIDNIEESDLILFLVSEGSYALKKEWLMLELWQTQKLNKQAHLIFIDIEKVPNDDSISFLINKIEKDKQSIIKTSDEGDGFKKTIVEINRHVRKFPTDEKCINMFNPEFEKISITYIRELGRLNNRKSSNVTKVSSKELKRWQLQSLESHFAKIIGLRLCKPISILVITPDEKNIIEKNIEKFNITCDNFSYLDEFTGFLEKTYDCIIMDSQIGLSKLARRQEEEYALNLLGMLNAKSVIWIISKDNVDKYQTKYQKIDEFVSLKDINDCNDTLANALIRCLTK